MNCASRASKNKFVQHLIEIPLELRWRTSTASDYKFWRIYFGIKTSYVFSSKHIFDSSSGKTELKDLPFNKFQSGFTLNAGNNTWNLGLYIGLQPILNEDFTKNYSSIKNIKQFKVGLVFYVF